MSSSARNPKIDPHPGDIVSFGPQWQRELYRVVSVDVRYAVDHATENVCSLEQWREWAKDAEVLHVAE